MVWFECEKAISQPSNGDAEPGQGGDPMLVVNVCVFAPSAADWWLAGSCCMLLLLVVIAAPLVHV
jgi:hypothetical protein